MNTKDDNITRSSAKRPPALSASAGLTAVAQVATEKGVAGTAALKAGLAAQTLAEQRGPDPSGSLRKHVQAAYDKSMLARKRLASARPSNPEDATTAQVYGKKASLSTVRKLFGR